MAAIPGSLPPPTILDFVQRFNTLQTHRDLGNQLMKEILLYSEHIESTLREENSQLAKELEDAQLDLEDARRSRREMQQKLTIATARAASLFNETLISQGLEGGKQAANALRNSVLQNCGDLADEIEVIAKVCANMSGLAKAMRRDGSLANPDDLRDFTLGFTQGKASFDFIDVGHGKERADSKIKECMRWHLRNHNCKQILLGISHDAGYAPFLDEVVSQDDRNRITIIEGYPTVRELAATGIQIMNFNALFRSDKLVDRLVPVSSPTPPSTWAGVTSIAPPPSSSISPVIKNGTPSTTSTINKKPPTANTTTIPKVNWSPEPRGLDPPITVNAVVLDKIKRRTNNNKLCNNHYLRGPCAKGSECCFEHDYKATDEDLKAIAYLTRLNPCTKGQDCELEFCIYGHHCPSVVMLNGGKEVVCQAFGCRFAREDHPPGTVIKHPRKEKWERVEYYQ
ncbi:hypothetical protein LHYA1_G007805 [Lachnellula hyalina]|uniref:C3H1-type domain-containing protein n=1 Tax=Lachnellula hyalina TaxID=1316788 RepID=A0A8H8TXB3_9HELO|nr:uncharacterized protein LHYA1_G007805 [Lachnellula hyalina]TVY24130.1 hypothetical protein LHYA1_G007805 [Lachnellula hyalina]